MPEDEEHSGQDRDGKVGGVAVDHREVVSVENRTGEGRCFMAGPQWAVGVERNRVWLRIQIILWECEGGGVGEMGGWRARSVCGNIPRPIRLVDTLRLRSNGADGTSRKDHVWTLYRRRDLRR